MLIAGGSVSPPVTEEAPVITLNGEVAVELNIGDTYTDQGATATDDIDGDLTSDILVVSTVDIEATGSYTISYNVADQAGNQAVEVLRMVIVLEPTPVETTLDTTATSTTETL